MQSIAQTDEQRNSIIEQRIEEIAGNLDEGAELDYTTLFEALLYYFEHPLNLNAASAEDLREMSLLSEVQIVQLQRHMATYGPMHSLYELQAVRGFDAATIRSIQPFVAVAPPSMLAKTSLKTIVHEGTHDLFLRSKRVLQKQKGFELDTATGKTPFAGTPNQLYMRYRFQFRKNLIAGVTMENDAGESLQNGPDFASAHLMYTDNGIVRKAIVGDYQVLFGQGLTFWNGLGFGKSPFVLNVKKNALGLRPYTSAVEGNYLRGGAVTLGVKSFELTPFFSMKNVGANLVDTPDTLLTDDNFVATSINTSGLHRTESERADRHTLQEMNYGANLRYNTRTLTLGFTAVHTQFDKALTPDLSPYEVHRFSGDANTNMGLEYQWVAGNANFFGELSRSANGGLATLNGLVASLSNTLSFSMVHRWFEPQYQALRVNVFAENNTTANNEHGLFTGIQAQLTPRWRLTAYSDLVQYPWLRSRADAPGHFQDYLLQLNYNPDRRHEFYLRYRHRNNPQNSADEDLLITSPVDVQQETWRLNGVYQVHRHVQMKTRAEWSLYSKEGVSETGYLVYQDVVIKKLGLPVSLTLRYALFNTTSNTRIYAYESDVLYAFTIPQHSGQGSRFYTMLKWDVTRKLDLWLRFGTWIYYDRQVISSGNTEITGNKKSEVNMQLRMRF
ncbi:MAG: ComEA family DNA-binding protein [Flavobacteriales bacterium]